MEYVQVFFVSFSELMKRLDDVSDDVRIACLKSLAAVTPCLPSDINLEVQNHLRVVYSSLLLHMDDSNEAVREEAFKTLAATGSKCPGLLLDLSKKAMDKHVHRDECSKLIEHLQGMKV